MPSKRTPKHRQPGPAINEAAVEIWRKLSRARTADAERELVLALQQALRLGPWVESPWSAVGSCPYSPDCAGALYWPLARALRHALIKAAA